LELVYLWVENYKNIHEQGFNFSSRFNCDYNKKTNELTIEENDDYIPNFFGKNINVTAIVGKNGSGKSNLLELLFNRHASVHKQRNHFFILYKETKLELYFFQRKYLKFIKEISLNKKYHIDIKLGKNEGTSSKKRFDSIFYSNLFQNLPIHNQIRDEHFDISKINLIDSSDEQKDMNFRQQYYSNKSKSIKNTIFMLKEKTLKIPFTIPKQLNMLVDHLYIEEDNKDILLNEFKRLRELNNSRNFYSDLIEQILYNYFHIFHGEDNYSEIEDILKAKSSKNIKELLDKADVIALYPQINSFLESIQRIEEYQDTEGISLLSLNLSNIDLEFSKNIWEMGNSLLNIMDVLHFNWKPELSTGQESFLFQFSNFYTTIINSKNKNLLILVDEGETTLHPQWQKMYVKYMIDFFTNNFSEKKFHLVFSSHSPFLLSDIPKQNIIFLDRYKKKDKEVIAEKQLEGNCKVVDGLKEKKQTFGANIHTLLSDSFFMEDGLMGEFAKNKIMQIKKFHQKVLEHKNHKKFKHYKYYYKTIQEEFEQIHSIIGEPFLQKIIKNYLDDLEILFSDDNTLIEKELEEIENRRVYLEGLKNDKT